MSELTRDAMLSIYPYVLDHDKTFNALGRTGAEALGKAFIEADNGGIYTRINKLDEGILDILAVDFNISWYDFDYDLSTKRRVIAAAFGVLRRKGTKESVVRAISSVWPNSQVEEWFEYDGSPYHFRVILDTTESEAEIDIDTALNLVRMFKPARAVMDNDDPIVKVTFGIEIQTDSQSHLYHTPVSGTLPRWANHGSYENDGLRLGTGSESAVYSVRRCGMPAGL